MRKYFLDPYIVSILYRTQNDEETLKHYQEIMDKLMLIVQESVRYYLQQKNVAEKEINKTLAALDKSQSDELAPEITTLLKDPGLGELLNSSIDGYGKIIYDSLLPTLDADERKELNRYLEASEPIIKQDLVNTLMEMLPQDNTAPATPAEVVAPVEEVVPVTPATIKANESAAVAQVPVTLQNVSKEPGQVDTTPEQAEAVTSETVATPEVTPAAPEPVVVPAVTPEPKPVTKEEQSAQAEMADEQAPGVDWESLIMESIEKNKNEMNGTEKTQTVEPAVTTPAVEVIPAVVEAQAPAMEAVPTPTVEATPVVETQAIEPAPIVAAETPQVVPLAQPIQPAEQIVAQVTTQAAPNPTPDLHQSTADKLSALGVDLADTAPQQPVV